MLVFRRRSLLICTGDLRGEILVAGGAVGNLLTCF